MIDRTLSHYRILEKLGEGGMGVVYKARDLHLDRFVAVKVLPADKVSDPERCRRFVQEAKAASALNHPNIVTIYDIDQADGVHFMAMEFVAGKTLGQLIGRKGLPLKETLNFAVQIAEALGKAHAAGIVHRDLKPSNIMVTDEDLVKILDFGLAKLLEPSAKAKEDALTVTLERTPVTEDGLILGTAAYMSPEQAEGKTVDGRSDIFSFGSVLYEMITGRRPFTGETSASILAAIIIKDPVPPSEISSALPIEVEQVVMRCLRKEPQRRLQTMSDLKVLLQDLKEGSESGTLSAVRLTPAPRKSRMWLIGAISALLLIAAGVGTVWYFLRQAPEAPAAEMERLTFESGMVQTPAISKDSKLLAYASDRTGSFDIYVRQLNSQQAIRRTENEANDWFPSFSPDGSKIVFRSERDGGGIYTMDALVGPEQKIADAGRLPSFSPDGATVLFLVGSPLVGRAKLFLVSANGGAPQPFQPEFIIPPVGPTYSFPLWSPDGKYILFEGMKSNDWKSRDWWIAPTAGGEAGRVGAPPRRAGVSIRHTVAWTGNYVYYSEGTTTGGTDLSRVSLAHGPWRIGGKPERLSSTGGLLHGASVSADGRMVFALMDVMVNIWAVGLQANNGISSGQLQSVTSDSLLKLEFTVAANGSRIAYPIAAPKNLGIRVRDLATGREDQVVGSGSTANQQLSADGALLAYSDRPGGKLASFVTEPGAPAARQVCQGCLVQGFFGNGTEVLADYGDKVVRQNIVTGKSVTLMDTSGLELMDMRLSPGDRWLAYTMPRPDMKAGLYIAAVGPQPSRQDTWVEIATDANYLGTPSWSPDGKLLYYASNRDGFTCVWAQAIASDGRPVGAPIVVFHHHKSSPTAMILNSALIRVTPDKLYMLLAESKGSLWSIKLNR